MNMDTSIVGVIQTRVVLSGVLTDTFCTHIMVHYRYKKCPMMSILLQDIVAEEGV